jgi:hypothetical protein
MTVPMRYLGQAVCYAAVALLFGYFSSAPAYAPVPPDQALIKLSFVHGAQQRRGDCRRLSPEELAKLAPNMRKATECPRERLPVTVELELDDELLYAATLPPTGLSGDGPSRAYQRFVVPPGQHRLVARLRDTARTEGLDHVRETGIELRPGQSLAVDFNPVAGNFKLE